MVQQLVMIQQLVIVLQLVILHQLLLLEMVVEQLSEKRANKLYLKKERKVILK
jgi:hypothetical protein